MITPILATIILLILLVFLLFIIPLLDSSERFGKYISLRYTLVVIFAVAAVGCILDFSHLESSSRNIVLMGGIILVGLFVLIRTFEKSNLGSKITLKAKHDNTEGSIIVDPKLPESKNDEVKSGEDKTSLED